MHMHELLLLSYFIFVLGPQSMLQVLRIYSWCCNSGVTYGMVLETFWGAGIQLGWPYSSQAPCREGPLYSPDF